MSLNDEVQEAVARWQGYTKLDSGIQVNEDVIGYVQPAEVKALIEAVTTLCPDELCHNGLFLRVRHEDCGGTGRVPRDWEEIGEGALEGVLRHWYWANLRSLPSISEFHSISPHSDSAALAAVDKALVQIYRGKL